MNTAEITLYGIPHCDTVKKSRAWLTAQGFGHVFHDFRKLGVPADRLALWMDEAGWEKLLNRQGTTWRKLGPDVQARVVDAASASALMQEHPSLIKRPVVEWPVHGALCLTVGFDPAGWDKARKSGKTV